MTSGEHNGTPAEGGLIPFGRKPPQRRVAFLDELRAFGYDATKATGEPGVVPMTVPELRLLEGLTDRPDPVTPEQAVLRAVGRLLAARAQAVADGTSPADAVTCHPLDVSGERAWVEDLVPPPGQPVRFAGAEARATAAAAIPPGFADGRHRARTRWNAVTRTSIDIAGAWLALAQRMIDDGWAPEPDEKDIARDIARSAAVPTMTLPPYLAESLWCRLERISCWAAAIRQGARAGRWTLPSASAEPGEGREFGLGPLLSGMYNAAHLAEIWQPGDVDLTAPAAGDVAGYLEAAEEAFAGTGSLAALLGSLS